MNAIFSEALRGYETLDAANPGVRRILLHEGVPYDWTSGLELSRLEKKRAVPAHDARDLQLHCAVLDKLLAANRTTYDLRAELSSSLTTELCSEVTSDFGFRQLLNLLQHN